LHATSRFSISGLMSSVLFKTQQKTGSCEFEALARMGFPTHNSIFYRRGPLLALPAEEIGRMSSARIEVWMRLVAAYSCCIFTRPSDKLFAFSGIAKLFQNSTEDIYIAGLWKSRLVETMHWYVDAPQPLLSLTNRAPSWPWASLDGRFS
jgi:hypothetical protein